MDQVIIVFEKCATKMDGLLQSKDGGKGGTFFFQKKKKKKPISEVPQSIIFPKMVRGGGKIST